MILKKDGLLILIVIISLLPSACAVFKEKKVDTDPPDVAAAKLYTEASKALNSGSYDAAIESLETLQTRFPFGEQARLAQLDLGFAYYKNNDRENAIATLDRFIRENPRHEKVAYAYYLRGLAYFEVGPGKIQHLLGVEQSERPANNDRTSFNYFEQLVERFPDSPYSKDGKEKMVLLRNRMADYELNVASYYFDRGAYVACARRVRYLLETFPDATNTSAATTLLAHAYQKLGLGTLASDAERVAALNHLE